MLYNGVVKGGMMKTKWIRVGGLGATKDECHETWTYGPRSSGDWSWSLTSGDIDKYKYI